MNGKHFKGPIKLTNSNNNQTDPLIGNFTLKNVKTNNTLNFAIDKDLIKILQSKTKLNISNVFSQEKIFSSQTENLSKLDKNRDYSLKQENSNFLKIKKNNLPKKNSFEISEETYNNYNKTNKYNKKINNDFLSGLLFEDKCHKNSLSNRNINKISDINLNRNERINCHIDNKIVKNIGSDSNVFLRNMPYNILKNMGTNNFNDLNIFKTSSKDLNFIRKSILMKNKIKNYIEKSVIQKAYDIYLMGIDEKENNNLEEKINYENIYKSNGANNEVIDFRDISKISNIGKTQNKLGLKILADVNNKDSVADSNRNNQNKNFLMENTIILIESAKSRIEKPRKSISSEIISEKTEKNIKNKSLNKYLELRNFNSTQNLNTDKKDDNFSVSKEEQKQFQFKKTQINFEKPNKGLIGIYQKNENDNNKKIKATLIKESSRYIDEKSERLIELDNRNNKEKLEILKEGKNFTNCFTTQKNISKKANLEENQILITNKNAINIIDNLKTSISNDKKYSTMKNKLEFENISKKEKFDFENSKQIESRKNEEIDKHIENFINRINPDSASSNKRKQLIVNQDSNNQGKKESQKFNKSDNEVITDYNTNNNNKYINDNNYNLENNKIQTKKILNNLIPNDDPNRGTKLANFRNAFYKTFLGKAISQVKSKNQYDFINDSSYSKLFLVVAYEEEKNTVFLKEALEKNITLRWLEFKNNDITDFFGENISNIICNNKYIYGINFEYNNLSENSGKIILEALKNSEYIEWADFKENCVVDSFYENLSDLFKENYFINMMNITHSNLTDENLLTLFSGIMFNRTLRRLNLSNNLITDKGLEMISGIIKYNKKINFLSFANNSITDGGMKILQEILESNTSITELNLNGNFIGKLGFAYILESFKVNKTLLKLNLESNLIDDDCVEILIEFIHHNNNNTNPLVESKASMDKNIETEMTYNDEDHLKEKKKLCLNELRLGNNQINDDSLIDKIKKFNFVFI